MEFETLSKKVIVLAIEVHKNLGPGLLENTYKQCLAYELNQANINQSIYHVQIELTF
jgi:GxxExxY protein